MSKEYSEDQLIEQATEDTLKNLGWQTVTAWHNESFGENSLLGREDKSEVILVRHLQEALQRLNPGLPLNAYQQAIENIQQKVSGLELAQINRDKYELLKNGIPVSFTNSQGELQKNKLKVFDFEKYSENHFLAVRQLEILGELYTRRTDIVGFVNGIPLLFIELKAPGISIQSAYSKNLKDYKDTIPHLFHTNAFVVLSNGTEAKVGTISSAYKYFLDWKRIEENEEGTVSLDTLLKGTCAPHQFMDLFENFLLFDQSRGKVIKLMAKNHQYLGVNKVLENVKNIQDLKGKLGVFWHTQGSGKSYSMVFLCEKIHRKLGGAYTFLIVLDRTELENQIYDTFSGVGVVKEKNIIAGKKKGLNGREHLRKLLAENHRYVFSLIHKFSIDPKKESQYPLITERDNVIVISDEAHRTQGGKYARNMRFRALPNASFLGFTGTPIIKNEEELTKNIFGEYVSVYDFKRAIEDEATLPLRYINKGDQLDIENPQLDDQMAEILEDENLDEDQKRKLNYLFSQNYPVLTAHSRLDAIAKDLVWHFNERGYQGKAMFVALDKPTAVKMYDLITHYWPQYLQELDQRIKQSTDIQEEQLLQRKYDKIKETEICVVVSSDQNEVDTFKKLQLNIEPHRRKMVDNNLEKRFKDPEDPFRFAIVCAMWITGFDAQCVSTVYLDKPIKGHTLMQTIARANRVYDDEKENGLIVDYGNVYEKLEEAYATYGEGGRPGKPGSDDKRPTKPIEELLELENELKKAITEVREYLSSLQFDLSDLIEGDPMAKITLLQKGVDCVCLNDTTRTTFEIMARNVFRKYKALYPEKQAKNHTPPFSGIEAIYNVLNKKAISADVSEVIINLQSIVDESIVVKQDEVKEEVYIDLGSLDFDRLKAAFAKTPHKNKLTYDLQKAIETKIERMLQENPLRTHFYEHYQEIIEQYNSGKSQANTSKIFDELIRLFNDLSHEEKRALREKLGNQEALAIFDLLVKGKELETKDLKEVKNIAIDTLKKIKSETLKIERWKESRQLKAQLRSTIYDYLLKLPPSSYSDDEVDKKTVDVYQHIYSNYSGGGLSVYN